jgi:3-oxoacyl-(acyl-carrier-protein) synthase
MLESLEAAEARGARIYAELLGGALNCGGHRDGGSMTAPNPEAVQECIRMAITDAGIDPREIDAINGHLTGTFADPHEVRNWSRALERPPAEFPADQRHQVADRPRAGRRRRPGAGRRVLQLQHRFVHGSKNCEDLHAELAPFAASIPHETVEPSRLEVFAKASFGFGDVNGCVMLRRWN